ncbi:hypothetical protein [Amycolatopsis magusensis]|uniref:hypothetical protein n=1 Tax=Amycolatopsis magusensis TaxID=882444 RepID=UPI003C2B8E8B
MKNTSVRTAVLYSASGGFLTILFGLLGAAAAQAAPKADNDAHMRDVHAVAEQNRKDRAAQEQQRLAPAPAPPSRPQPQPRQADREQADRETRKFENQAAEAREKKQKAEDQRNSEDRENRKFNRQAEDSRKQQQAERDREKVEDARKSEDRENRKFTRQADQARKADDAQDQADRETRKFDRQATESRKQKDAQNLSAVAEQNRKDRNRDESLREHMRGTNLAAEQNRKDRAADERERVRRSIPPVSGLRALEVREEIERTAGPARMRADELAGRRDAGPSGSVRAWETTERLAAEAEGDARWRERLRDVGKPRPVVKPPKTIELDEPISGLRALEVKDEIARTVGPAKERAASLKKLRDETTGPGRAELAEEARAANREAKRLEFLDDAGKSVWEKTQDSVDEDVRDAGKLLLGAADLATTVETERLERQSLARATEAADDARAAARELSAARRAARLPDGTIDPAKQAELDQKRAVLRTAVGDAATASTDHRAKLKKLGALGRVGGGVVSGAGAVYDLEQGKSVDEVIAGTVGGLVGGFGGGFVGGLTGPAAPVAAPVLGTAGGLYGSAFLENLYKDTRDSVNGRDINDAVNED